MDMRRKGGTRSNGKWMEVTSEITTKSNEKIFNKFPSISCVI